MGNLADLLPSSLDWLRASALALSSVLFGLAVFRLGIQRLIRWIYQAEPDNAQGIIQRLIPPFLLTLVLLSANAFRGLFGVRVDWWLGALLIPALGVLLIEILRLGVVDYALRLGGRRPAPKILRDIVFGLIYTTAMLAYVGTVFKVDLAPILTTSAILSVVIGMALQDTLGNLFAGLAINLDRPFNLGDWVSIDGEHGRVVEITWRATKIVTSREEMHILPNNAISKAKVVNYQLPTTCYGEAMDIGISYDIPPNRVREVGIRVALEVPGVRRNPYPEVHLLYYGDSAIVYRFQIWVDDFGQTIPIRGQFQERLWYHLRRDGISIPFPIRTLHMVDAERQVETLRKENLRALRRIDVIACMDPESIATLASKARMVHYARGERIFSQNDVGGSLYIIKHGLVTLSLDDQGGRNTKPFASLAEGDFFGEMSLLTGERRTASAHATTDCDLLVIEQHHLAPLLEEHPEFMRLISHTIAERRQKIESAKMSLAEARERLVPAESRENEAVEATSNEILNRIRSFFKLT